MADELRDILRNRVKEKLARDEVVASMTVRLSRSIEAKGSGEFSGTSISSKPLSTSAATMDSDSSGRMPRRMAMSERVTVGQETGSVMS